MRDAPVITPSRFGHAGAPQALYKLACCLDCHFKREERLVFPYLPDDLRATLADTHTSIRAAIRHGVSEALVRAIADDHADVRRRLAFFSLD